jgi:hypothetical protein
MSPVTMRSRVEEVPAEAIDVCSGFRYLRECCRTFGVRRIAAADRGA